MVSPAATRSRDDGTKKLLFCGKEERREFVKVGGGEVSRKRTRLLTEAETLLSFQFI